VALGTYSELQAAIIAWAMRSGDTDFAAQVPDFVVLCEARLNRILRVREMETTATLTLASDGTASLPADYLAFRDVTALGYSPARSLDAVSPDYAVDEHPFDGEAPQHFSITGSTLRTHPKGSGTVRLRYFQAIPALAANATNWLLSKSPGVYLYGSLLEAAPYMFDDSRMQVWSAMFDKAVSDLVSEDHQAKYMRGRVRPQGATP